MTQTATQVISTFHEKPGKEEELPEVLPGLIELPRAPDRPPGVTVVACRSV